MKPGHRAWTPKESAIVKKEYYVTPTPELALKIGRTVSAVVAYAHRLGIQKRRLYWYEPAKRQPKTGARHIAPYHRGSRDIFTSPLEVEAVPKLKPKLKPRKSYDYDKTPCSERRLGYVR